MAQTGYTPILIYSSSTTTNAPAVGNLTNSTLGSELAINITDGKLFYKDNANAIQVIGWKVTPTTAGGTGLTSYTAGDMLYYVSGTVLSKLGIGSADYVMTSSGTAPQWSQFVKAISGGTGQTSYAVGDILYANTTTTLAKLADVATGNALISGGVGVAPSWGKIALTTHVSGVLPVANGGTNASSAIITAFNNITGYTASGATGTTSTNLVFSTSPTLTTPSVTGDLTMSTGNVVMSDGKGVDFSATPGTGTSELFADYEEGTWTPSMASNTLSTYAFSSSSATYTKVGRVVTIQGTVVINGVPGSGSFVLLYNLPYAVSANNKIVGNFSNGAGGDGYYRNGPSGNWVNTGTYNYALQYGNNAATLLGSIASGDSFTFTLTYQV
jgi:hypothetical protein